MSLLVDWIGIHWGLFVAAAATVSAVIVKGPALLEGWGRVYRRLLCVPETPLSVSCDDFAEDDNARYGFKFAHPKDWDRLDPANGDGSTYAHPKFPSVRISAWGAIPIEDLIGNSGAPDRSAVHATAAEREGRNILRVDSGRYETLNIGGEFVRWKVPGARSDFDLKQNGKKLRVMNLCVESFYGTRIQIRCVSPKYLFASFEPTFLFVCSSLELFPGLQTSR